MYVIQNIQRISRSLLFSNAPKILSRHREERRKPAAAMQISEVAQHQWEFKDTNQLEVLEMGSQALHVIQFITKKLFSVIC